MIRLFAAGDGSMRFARRDSARERAALRQIVALRRRAEERLHERHMAHLGVKDDPTRVRPATREVLHVVNDSEEDQLWAAWRAFLGS